ncbi:dihydroorotate oxidase [Cavenderia fasciculata]|uniref:Dihydroorotate oxidase n=1 Tax=Cavenderia fasciculata TaxID=261658 RepID=F4PN55_CACFS|nr:dihydroorotate oxidase [Cavenderia fasciculata]EGG23745.1 dihydroorotate oxidase [Cavenderia fasciculata]|eukprot:XP_004361596.1 dihydroorotate oxidase [Cavenderia fasciculata]
MTQWFPEHKPIYDLNKSWEYNLENGPFVEGFVKQERKWAPKEKWIDFLGVCKVASPLGVPAGPLLNSAWIDFAAQAGFDILTYKTIRSNPYNGHAVPNIVYIDVEKGHQFSAADSGITVKTSPTTPTDMDSLSITNSFGMPSKDREYLLQDIKKANGLLADGQVMIVSVTGTSHSAHEFVKDMVDVARIAVEAGSKVVEVNYSCPNVVTGEGQIYNNPDQVYEISKALVSELQPHNIPLVIKVGVLEDKNKMEKLMLQAHRAGVTAIAGINTMSMKVIDRDTNEPALGPGRLSSGVCGAPIRQTAIDWISQARQVIDQHKLPLQLIGCGGIVQPQHFDDFLNAGANFCTSATGLMWDPYLALKWHNMKN